MIGRGVGRQTTLAKTENILQRYNRGIDNHANRKGKSSQRDHIDRQAKPGNGNKGADHRHRNGGKHDDRRQQAAQEQHQDAKRQNAADPDILLHQINRRGDVFRLVIDNA